MSSIKNILGTEILDSNKKPTLAVTVELSDGSAGKFAVPSGTSTGLYEALELRDNDPTRYHGQGVLKAVEVVNLKLKKLLIGQEANNQAKIDQMMIELDGTSNKSKLGANGILGVSIAVAKAAANSSKLPLYQYLRQLLGTTGDQYNISLPMMVMIEGGKHGKENKLSFQEFLVIGPLTYGQKIWQSLRQILVNQGRPETLGMEGGFASTFKNTEDALNFLITAVTEAGYQPGKNIYLAMDIAASQLKKDKYYLIDSETMTSDELIEYLQKLTNNCPIFALEDPLSQDDWSSWTEITRRIGSKVKIIGDDLFVTNPTRIKEGIAQKATNAVLIKPNQVGTLSETLKTIKIAKDNNLDTVVSHRSGETFETFIADLAIASDSIALKAGAPNQPVRLVKYQRLAEIEKEIAK